MRKHAVMCLTLMLSGMVFPYAAYAQGIPCTEKTFNTVVSWAKKKDVKSFSSRLNVSGKDYRGDEMEGVDFVSQKPDPKNPELPKVVSMKKAGIVKELNTKNSEIWTFFNVHLPMAKYTPEIMPSSTCCLDGSLSSAWIAYFCAYEKKDGDWTIGVFGYRKVVKETEVGENTQETESGEDTPETAEDKTEPDNNNQGKEILVEYNGQWYPAVILEQKDDKYLIHYHDYDSSWDEWVTKDRIKEKE